MIITKRLMGKAIAVWLGPTGDAARRAVTELREKVTKAPRKLTLYVDVAEPWSYLTAIDYKTGKIAWRHRYPGAGGFGGGNGVLATASKLVFAGDLGGRDDHCDFGDVCRGGGGWRHGPRSCSG